jgi:hypothetical protein
MSGLIITNDLGKVFRYCSSMFIEVPGIDNSGGALVGFVNEVGPAEDEGEPGDGEEGGVVAEPIQNMPLGIQA